MTNEVNKKLENDLLSVRAVPSTNYVLEGIVNKLYVMFEIKGGELPHDKPIRNTFDLALVLDRSGSMAGDKLKNAKSAVENVIQNLRRDDKLHLVQYDDSVDTVFKNGDLKNRDILLQQVRKVRSGGSTDLMGGIQQGYHLIDKDSNKSRRIFLFSDGLANAGIHDPNLIQKGVTDMYEKKGVNITTFGIGSDFNELLMQGIAEKTAGDFFFIDNPDKIPNLVGEALEGLLNVIASNIQVKARGKNGCTVTKVYGHDLRSGAFLGDVKESEIRQIIFEIEVNPEKLRSDGNFGEIEISYTLASDILNKKINVIDLHITSTSDETKLEEESEEVLIAKKLMEIAEQESEILRFIEQEQYDDALKSQQLILDELEGMSGKGYRSVEQKLRTSLMDMQSLRRARVMRDEFSKSMSLKRKHYSHYMSMQSKNREIEDPDETD